ncbi:VTT domain-containing protein [Microvirga sp. W0021]|uniref:TVP38/TMEM64 family membrane protein n=1 Tax=Hohaiivirga grylli TaxID=3133970 RepID=A0ABV0BL15_9HYPH
MRKRLLPFILLILLGCSILVSGLMGWIDFKRFGLILLSEASATHEVNLPLLFIFISLYVLAVVLSLPLALPLTLIGGFLFGGIIGGAIAVFAKTLGSFIFFCVARYGLIEIGQDYLNRKFHGLNESIKENAFLYMLFLRFQPVVPFFVVNIAAAFFRIRPMIFVAATMIGIAPGAFIAAFTGNSLRDIAKDNVSFFEQCLLSASQFCDEAFSTSQLWTPKTLLLSLSLAALALVPILIKSYAGNQVVDDYKR